MMLSRRDSTALQIEMPAFAGMTNEAPPQRSHSAPPRKAKPYPTEAFNVSTASA